MDMYLLTAAGSFAMGVVAEKAMEERKAKLQPIQTKAVVKESKGKKKKLNRSNSSQLTLVEETNESEGIEKEIEKWKGVVGIRDKEMEELREELELSQKKMLASGEKLALAEKAVRKSEKSLQWKEAMMAEREKEFAEKSKLMELKESKVEQKRVVTTTTVKIDDSKLVEAEARIKALEDERTELQSQLEIVQKNSSEEMEDLQRDLASYKSHIEALEFSNRLLTNEVSQSVQKKAAYEEVLTKYTMAEQKIEELKIVNEALDKNLIDSRLKFHEQIGKYNNENRELTVRFTVQLNDMRHELDKNQNVAEKFERQVNEMRREVNVMQSREVAAVESCKSMEQSLEELKTEKAEFLNQLYRAEETLRSAVDENAAFRETISLEKKLYSELVAEKSEMENKIVSIQKELEAIKDLMNSATEEKNALLIQMEELKNRPDENAEGLKSQIEQLSVLLETKEKNAISSREVFKAKEAEMQEIINDMSARKTENDAELSKANLEIRALTFSKQELEIQISDLKKEFEELKANIQSIANVQQSLQAAEESSKTVTEQLHKALNEKHVLEDLARNVAEDRKQLMEKMKDLETKVIAEDELQKLKNEAAQVSVLKVEISQLEGIINELKLNVE